MECSALQVSITIVLDFPTLNNQAGAVIRFYVQKNQNHKLQSFTNKNRTN